jgi:hypothetical protein
MAWALTLLGIVIAGLSLWWVTGSGDAALSSRLTILPAVPAGAIAAAGAVRLGLATYRDARARMAWSALVLALLIYAIGVLIHFAAGTVLSLDAIWLVGLGLEIACYLMVAVALALLLKSDRTIYDMIRMKRGPAVGRRRVVARSSSLPRTRMPSAALSSECSPPPAIR